MKEAFEKMTGMPDAWTNPALMVSRNAFIQGWEARAQHDVDATIIQYHEATIKRLEKRIEELAQPAQEPWCMKMNRCTTKCEDCPDEPAKRPWVGLTHQEISNEVISDEPDFVQGFVQGARWADALLEEKNT